MSITIITKLLSIFRKYGLFSIKFKYKNFNNVCIINVKKGLNYG